LLEETGYKSLKKPKKLLNFYPDPGRLNHKVFCFYSNKLKKVDNPEKGMKIFFCTKNQIFKLIKNGKFNNGAHIAAFQYYLSNI